METGQEPLYFGPRGRIQESRTIRLLQVGTDCERQLRLSLFIYRQKPTMSMMKTFGEIGQSSALLTWTLREADALAATDLTIAINVTSVFKRCPKSIFKIIVTRKG